MSEDFSDIADEEEIDPDKDLRKGTVYNTGNPKPVLIKQQICNYEILNRMKNLRDAIDKNNRQIASLKEYIEDKGKKKLMKINGNLQNFIIDRMSKTEETIRNLLGDGRTGIH